MEDAFSPGPRLSALDVVVLSAAGACASWAAYALGPGLGVVLGLPAACFFLFCNVFRVGLTLELWWAVAYLPITSVMLAQLIPWQLGVGLAVLLCAAVIAIAMRSPTYHGLGWQRVNPELRERWDAAREA